MLNIFRFHPVVYTDMWRSHGMVMWACVFWCSLYTSETVLTLSNCRISFI